MDLLNIHTESQFFDKAGLIGLNTKSIRGHVGLPFEHQDLGKPHLPSSSDRCNLFLKE